ncbi:oxidoreductase [Streptacidiphilus fuscans]|uniref:Oxidoreductase n=1 Tax=Streptacidiphilus fuscans TaxID=2789292 RepID=A0A931B0K7_9ACTN|nr:oxidoreductase [Streptacidiphilus fuscans]MBF9068864.1 oxidoreductase [Streptacidiphilus fuscans]
MSENSVSIAPSGQVAPSGKVVLVTGASSGIGEATVRRLQALGCTVYAAARRVERMSDLAELDRVHVVGMDVTDPESNRAGVERILAEAGRIDVLVNNAGYGSYGAVEDVPLAEARAQFEVNLFGAADLIRRVLPQMRARRSGRIVNISSMGGRLHSPLGGWYHATKFAVEGLSDCLRLELEPFGIQVVVIEPGAIKTEWGGIAADNLLATSGSGPYAGQAKAMAKTLRGERIGSGFGSGPGVVAEAIAHAVQSEKPRTRYAIGRGAKPLIMLRRVLPDRAFDSLMRRANRLPAPPAVATADGGA